MKKMSVVCNDETVSLFIDIIEKLQNAKGDIKIRIGGSEYVFYKGVDSFGGIAIDDIDYYSLPDADRNGFASMRSAAIAIWEATKDAVSDPIDEDDVAKSAAIVDDADTMIGIEVEDDDEFDEGEIACLDCGSYHKVSKIDEEGLCPNCTEEDNEVTLPVPSNLSGYASQKVRAEIGESIRMNRIFTAFDITKKIRKDGVRYKHEDVKQLVHDSFLNGELTGYTRTLIDVGTAIQPWLYCPVTRDASEYNHGDN